MKTKNKESQKGNATKKTSSTSSDKIKTDIPLSEKDEVKDAETRTQKGLKHNL
ncbi:hypothetical protein GCM10027049_20330 [Mucilaginibacter puniceus]